MSHITDKLLPKANIHLEGTRKQELSSPSFSSSSSLAAKVAKSDNVYLIDVEFNLVQVE